MTTRSLQLQQRKHHYLLHKHRQVCFSIGSVNWAACSGITISVWAGMEHPAGRRKLGSEVAPTQPWRPLCSSEEDDAGPASPLCSGRRRGSRYQQWGTTLFPWLQVLFVTSLHIPDRFPPITSPSLRRFHTSRMGRQCQSNDLQNYLWKEKKKPKRTC